MRVVIEREALLKPLQLISGVVERRQTKPVLANVLLSTTENTLSLTGTDLEVELNAQVNLTHLAESGQITVPARKLMDICRTLPEQAQIELILEGHKFIIRSSKSRFSLTTLPASEFPVSEIEGEQQSITVPHHVLRKIIGSTQFAMAEQDVRHYLNGMLLEIGDNYLRAVATDGHRMAASWVAMPTNGAFQVIVPRKGILELYRMLTDKADNLTISMGNNQLCIKADDYCFTSRLIDGKFPSYDRIIPQAGNKVILIERDTLKESLSRVAVLADETHHGVRVALRQNAMLIAANNPDQEEAEEEVVIDYQGDDLNIGFNIKYLQDAVSALPNGIIKLSFSAQESCVRIEQPNGGDEVYIVMPMHL